MVYASKGMNLLLQLGVTTTSPFHTKPIPFTCAHLQATAGQPLLVIKCGLSHASHEFALLCYTSNKSGKYRYTP